jgi:hypothetical protein
MVSGNPMVYSRNRKADLEPALSKLWQPEAHVETVSDSQGTTVSITHATFSGKTKPELRSESLNA